MSKFPLNTSAETYATHITTDDDRFDSHDAPERAAWNRMASVGATAAALLMAVTGAGAAVPTTVPNWSTSGGNMVVMFAVDPKGVLQTRLNAFRHLPAGWDGADGQAPTPEAVDEGLAFLDLLPIGAPMPTPFPAGDGEVGFRWKGATSFAEVSFYGDGFIYFYAKVGANGLEVEGAEPYARRSIPKELARALAEL